MEKITWRVVTLLGIIAVLIQWIVMLPAISVEKNPFEPAYAGQCTWYVAKKWIEMGWQIPSIRHARYWYSEAEESKKYQVGKEPKQEAIAVFHDPNSKSQLLRDYGHVAYVISASGNSWRVGEYNLKGDKQYSERSFDTWSPPALVGFVYPPVTGQLAKPPDRTSQSGRLPLAGYRDGVLLKGSRPEVYVIQGGRRSWIPDPATFKAKGYDWNKIVVIPDEELERIPRGPDVRR